MVRLPYSKGCQLLLRRLKSPAIKEGLEKRVSRRRVRAHVATLGLIELERVLLYTLVIRSN